MIIDLFDLQSRYVLITGAAGLLGEQHALAVAEANGIPILVDISEDRLNNLSVKIKKQFQVESLLFVCDITEEVELLKLKENLIKNQINLYGLINNAARNPKVESDQFGKNRLEELNLDEFNKDFSVGVVGALLCCKHFGPYIALNEDGGVIINISSDLGLIAPNQSLYSDKDTPDEDRSVKPISYSIIKSGLIGLTKYLATYWCSKKVRVNALCPGGIQNNQPEEFLEKISELIPLARMARKEEYKSTIIWMLSPSNSYLNGSIVSVDGGRTVW